MRLEPLMLLHATIGANLPVGDGGTGTRVVANVSGGHFDGARLRGVVQPSGADWVVIDPHGYGRVDVRLVLTTHDGANLYVQYLGLLEQNAAIGRAFAERGSTEFGDAYFVTQLRFETGHPAYHWLNHRLAIGEGRLRPGAVEYQVYELLPG